jgi:hypothetical protein
VIIPRINIPVFERPRPINFSLITSVRSKPKADAVPLFFVTKGTK